MAVINSNPAEYPKGNGKTVNHWFNNGYRAGMEDIAAIVDNGESAIDRLNAIREYIENNSHVLFD